MRAAVARLAVALLVCAAPAAVPAGRPAATVGATAIPVTEVDTRCGTPCVTLAAEVCARKWAVLETLVGEHLLAGLPPPPPAAVSPDAVAAYLAEHAADFTGPPERDRAAVAAFLAREQRRASERARLAVERARRPPVVHTAPDDPALCEPAGARVLATVGPVAIRDAEVETRAALALYRLRGELARERLRQAEVLVAEMLWQLEARAHGRSVDDLRGWVRARAERVTDADVDRWLAASREGEPAADRRRERARPYLEFHATRRAEEAFLAEARRRHRVTVHLGEPEAPRLALGAGAGGWHGPPRPTSRVVFLTGYRGRGSRAMWPTVERLAAEPGVALAVRPLLPVWDPEATAVAVAVRCAGRQGRSRAFHDAVAGRDPLPGGAALADVARELGLDGAAFAACVADAAVVDAVAAESAEAERLGLEAPPVVLLDGRVFGGVQGLDRLRAALRAGAATPR